ncbi:MAG: tRNA 2-thiouridine(34) synthase MnmA, partial [Planctomycetota bacterium]|nr:tRNA 2-thiouridine(34) synthase MnmA [Planctomycetota bacterium]
VWDDIEVQYRSAPQNFIAKLVCIAPQQVRIEFESAVESINPGQGVAVYKGSRLLGGGFISKVEAITNLEV